MGDLGEGEMVQVRGSSGSTYDIRNVGGVFSCTCPAWRNQSRPAHQRTCKHITQLRGAEVEAARLQQAGAVLGPPGTQPTPSLRVTTLRPSGEGEPPILLAHSWDKVSDLSGWWMSEKLDGVRAYWDGQRLLSRKGNPFVAPEWFIEGLPPHPLDGELWSGRRMFQRTVSIVRRQDASPEWRHIRYLVFDAPGLPQGFEERLEQCRAWLGQLPERFQVHHHQLCRGTDHLRAELARVEQEGGEGLMLRRPGSLYEVGRSWSLLKVKSFLDAEATVIGHQAGEGRHRGRLGALLVQLPDGTRFSVGSGFSDAERESPPPLGSPITFRYQELSNAGVPRFPTYVGVRFDAPTQPIPVKTKEDPPMLVVQTALAEACDLHSQAAQDRLGTLLLALHGYAGGKPQALQDYCAKYPFSRINEAIASAPPAKAPPSPRGNVAASKAPPPPKEAPAPVSDGYRRFEFADGTSSKFWEVALDGSTQTVRFGRIGSAGQSKSKAFASTAEAEKDTGKLMAEKVAKGYQEIAPA